MVRLTPVGNLRRSDAPEPAGLLSTAGNTSSVMNRAKRSDIVSYSRPRSLPLPSLPPFSTPIAMNAGNLRFRSVEMVRLSSALRTKLRRLGPSSVTSMGAFVPSFWTRAGRPPESKWNADRRPPGHPGRLVQLCSFRLVNSIVFSEFHLTTPKRHALDGTHPHASQYSLPSNLGRVVANCPKRANRAR